MAQRRSTKIITMTTWIRTSRLSMKKPLSAQMGVEITAGTPVEVRSRGRRSQTVGADCLTVCHPRDELSLSAQMGVEITAGTPVEVFFQKSGLTLNPKPQITNPKP